MDDEQQILLKLLTNSDRLLDAAMKLGVAYYGYKAAGHWSGSLNALIALKLAQSGNVVAGAAGVGVLTYIGATQVYPAYEDQQTKYYKFGSALSDALTKYIP